MNSRLRRRLVGSGLLAAFALAGWAAWVWTRPSLLRHATLVPCPFGEQYHWLSDRELIVLETDAERQGRTLGHILVIDAATGARRTVCRTDLPGETTGEWDYGLASPDGRWLVAMGGWETPAPAPAPGTPPGPTQHCYVAAVGLLGPAAHVWEVPVARHGAAWARDSRSMVVGSVTDRGYLLQRVGMSGPPTQPIGLRGVPAGDHGGQILGLLPDERALLWRGDGCFWAVNMATGQAASLDLTRALPKGDEAEQCALSPRGDRLAWVTTSRTADGYPHVVRSIAYSLRIDPDYQVTRTLLVTDLRGGHLGVVGRVGGPNYSARASIDTVRWLPGGRRLSFRQDTRLYTVPVE